MKKSDEDIKKKNNAKENLDIEYSDEMADIEYRDSIARAKAANQRFDVDNI
ncbi:YfhD family protein [Salipaludibacillus neizhouensis]|uniref:YfhD family protein n=1 Tax=Salipaludibacillus neizhouensis TaxID=885475 RepID=UPI000DA62457|nr:YfhD family protein [Salipaludibacillus neizhouensis]